MTKIVASIGGGIASTLFMPLKLLQQYPRDDLEFVTCHLPNEDKDLFLLEETVERILGITIKKIGHNKTPFDIFHEIKFLGNNRIDPCSRLLKREVMKDYILKTYSASDVKIAVGIGNDELDRTLTIIKRWKHIGYNVIFPLSEVAISREESMKFCQHFAGFVPRLYQMEFSHNNCGGACVKAGKKDWCRLLWFLPEVYDWWETNENIFREANGDFSILTENRNKVKYTLPLTTLRERVLPFFGDAERTAENFNKLPIYPILKEKLDANTGCNFCDAMG